MILCVDKNKLKKDDLAVQKNANLKAILDNHVKYYESTEEAYKDDFVPLDFCVCVRSVFSNKVLAFNVDGKKIYYQNMTGVPQVQHKGIDLIMYMTSIGVMHYVEYSKGFDDFMLNDSQFMCIGLYNSSSDFINPIILSHIIIKDDGLEELQKYLRPSVSIEDIESINPTGNLKPLIDSLIVLKKPETIVVPDSELTPQWKSGGDCNLCRRRKYCKKQCSASKKLVFKLQNEFIKKKMFGGDSSGGNNYV